MAHALAPRLFVALLAVLPLAACASSQHDQAADAPAHMGQLDGRKFVVTLQADGAGGKAESDTLSFETGKFRSTACDPYGFVPGAYTTTKIEGGWEFRASCTNDGGDRNDWRGVVRGDLIEGSFTWTPKRGAPVVRSYAGRVRN